MRWDQLNSRARGLAGHLLDRAGLRRVGAATTGPELLAILAPGGAPLPLDRAGRDEAELDAWVGQVAADRFRTLDRWLGPCRSALAVVLEDEERRTLRRLLRGAAQGGSAATRLRSVVPTPSLPRRLLTRLAAATSPADLADRLTRAGHPAGRALASAAAGTDRSGLFGLEVALSRTFAVRATRLARAGGPVVRRFAALTIDLENGAGLLASPSWGGEVGPGDVWLEGGELLSAADHRRIAMSRDPAEVGPALAAQFRHTPLEQVFRMADPPERGFEGRSLAARIRWLRGLARRDPLGPAPTLLVLERIRLEAYLVRAALWSIRLGAPWPVPDWLAAA